MFVFVVKEYNADCYKPAKMPAIPVFSTFKKAFNYVKECADRYTFIMVYDECPEFEDGIYLVEEHDNCQYYSVERMKVDEPNFGYE